MPEEERQQWHKESKISIGLAVVILGATAMGLGELRATASALTGLTHDMRSVNGAMGELRSDVRSFQVQLAANTASLAALKVEIEHLKAQQGDKK